MSGDSESVDLVPDQFLSLISLGDLENVISPPWASFPPWQSEGLRAPSEDLAMMVLLAKAIRESYMEKKDLKILASLSFVHYFVTVIGPKGRGKKSRRLQVLQSSYG